MEHFYCILLLRISVSSGFWVKILNLPKTTASKCHLFLHSASSGYFTALGEKYILFKLIVSSWSEQTWWPLNDLILPMKFSKFKDTSFSTDRDKNRSSATWLPEKEQSLEILWFSLVIQELQKIQKLGNGMFLWALMHHRVLEHRYFHDFQGMIVPWRRRFKKGLCTFHRMLFESQVG